MADRNDQELLLTLAVNLKRKDYEKVIAAGSLAKDDPLYNKSGIFICRALSETGKIDQAQAVLNDLLSGLSSSDPDYIPAKLWSAFHYLFASETIAFEETLEELDGIAQSSVAPDDIALRFALQSKTISFAVAVGCFSPFRLSRSIELMELAAAKYLEANNLVEHAASVRSIAGMLQNAPFYDYKNAVEKLVALSDLSGYPDQIFLRGTVALDLAGIKFKEMHLPGNTPNLEDTDLFYNNALNDFLAAGYLDAAGDVHFDYGRLLLDYGYPIGLNFLHKSIIYYKETLETGNRQAAWKKISDWHHRHGNDDEAKMAEQESLSLDREVEFKLNKAVQAVMEIHTAFIQHREGLAVELGEKYLAEHKASRMAPQIRALLANALSQGTRKALAVEHLRSIIDYYMPSAPSSFLSEAWFNYASTIFFNDPDNGVKAIETAIGMAEALHDDLGVAKYARELAVNISNHSVLARKFPEEKRITELFHKAYAALDRSNTFLSAVERVNTLEKQGLCCSQIKDNGNALQYFHEAGSMAARLGLKINQAFSQTYTGLTLLQLARDRKNAGIYKDAAMRFHMHPYFFLLLITTGFPGGASICRGRYIRSWRHTPRLALNGSSTGSKLIWLSQQQQK